jgi:hypothetical protein
MKGLLYFFEADADDGMDMWLEAYADLLQRWGGWHERLEVVKSWGQPARALIRSFCSSNPPCMPCAKPGHCLRD